MERLSSVRGRIPCRDAPRRVVGRRSDHPYLVPARDEPCAHLTRVLAYPRKFWRVVETIYEYFHWVTKRVLWNSLRAMAHILSKTSRILLRIRPQGSITVSLIIQNKGAQISCHSSEKEICLYCQPLFAVTHIIYPCQIEASVQQVPEHFVDQCLSLIKFYKGAFNINPSEGIQY